MTQKTLKTAVHGSVYICSPFRARERTADERERELRRNQAVGRLACRVAVRHGFVPLAPHLYFPQFLSDDDRGEREVGMRYGVDWLTQCDEVWVIGDRITEGMEQEILIAEELGIPVRRFQVLDASMLCLIPA